MNYTGKASHIVDTDALLPDKLNTFFARFEKKTELPTRTTATLMRTVICCCLWPR
jgi:hypothetical protein